MALQRKNERDLTIYTEQMLDLQKLIFNIRVWREVNNIDDMMEFNWASILQLFLYRQCRLDRKHGEPFLAFADPYIYPRYIYNMGKGIQIQKVC